MRSWAIGAGAIALLVAADTRGGGGAPSARSLAIYPEQRIALRFSHREHLAKGMSCVSCHDAAVRSDSARDRLIPPEARCAACHDIEGARAGKKTEPPAACEACHPAFDATIHRAPPASLFPRAALHFSHAKHLDRLRALPRTARDEECRTCHGSYAEVDLATRAQLPPMATCLDCHDGKRAPIQCSTCHLTAFGAKGARLETDLPSGQLRPGPGDPLGLDHGQRYDRMHALVAPGHREQCLACHSDRQCLACHDGTTKRAAIHPGDFVSTHAVPARADEPHCDACHRRQSFCIACHERVGVGAEAPAFQVQGHRVHPANWAQNHGAQAARNIGQCASCHREEGCLQCHATTGTPTPNAPTHPPGFSGNCGSLYRKNARACQKCHAASDPALAPCR